MRRLARGNDPKARTLSLAKAFHASLPREIRDMVYAYIQPLLGGKYHDVVVTDADRPPDFWKLASHPHRSFWTVSRRQVPWYLKPKWVGDDFAKEMAEYYYSTARFVFTADAGPTLVRRALTTDRFVYGIRPNAQIRRVHLSFKLHDFGGDAFSRYDTLRQTLEQLYSLEPQKGFLQVTIFVGPEPAVMPQFLRFAGVLLPVVLHLRMRGFAFDLDICKPALNCTRYRAQEVRWRIVDLDEYPIERSIGFVVEVSFRLFLLCVDFQH